MRDNLSIIRSVLKDKIIIESNESGLKNFLTKLGCKRRFFKRSIWVLSYANEPQLISYLDELRRANCLFSGGDGWSPSAIFQHFRECNFLTGVVKEITWVKPGFKCIREV